MLSGAYLGNDPRDVKAFEDRLGAPVDYVRAFTGRANWDDFKYSVPWVGEQLAQAGRPLLWTIPMFANQGSLGAAAQGDYNKLYVDIAQSVLKTSGSQDKIVIRFGEEFNGTWMPWSAAGHEKEFIQAFRNMVDAFRSVSNKFQFEWNVNLGGSAMNPADAYPGDAYVDIVSMDFYYNTQWGDPKDPAQAWDHFVNRDYGLQWLEDFAAKHHKPTAYSEWGVSSDAGVFIDKAFEWFREHDVVYQSYWYSDADFAGILNAARPNASAAFFSQMLTELTHTASSVEAPPPVSGTASAWHIGVAGQNDKLAGGSGNDYLVGGDGVDTATGGAGDDTYVVDRSDDVVIEGANGGIDTVESWAAKFVLSAHVENLKLLNTWGSTGIGNELANRITGSAGNDTIDGLGGNDYLTGGAGADTFVFRPGSGHDTITDFDPTGTGHDTIRIDDPKTTSFKDLTLVQSGADTHVILQSGDDIVLKNVSKDQLTASNVVFGTKPVAETPVVKADPPPVSGTASAWHIGVAGQNDKLAGGSGNDYLVGGDGVDTATGGAGDDTYVVDRSDDVVIEGANGGIDTVESWAAKFVLSAHVENLKLLNTWGSTGIGNELANRITGSAGNDTIDGLGGNDYLTGGAGADTFVFRPGSGHDTITDFEIGKDVVKLVGTESRSFAEIATSMVEDVNGTSLVLKSGDVLTFSGLHKAQFSATDFLMA